MQAKMQQHQLSEAEIRPFIAAAQVGRLATLDPDGYPYIVPVHYVLHAGKIYVHGLAKGQKVENILRDGRVCFETDEMLALSLPENGSPCSVGTNYTSVIVHGTARLVGDEALKKAILDLVVKKYAPQFAERGIPDAAVCSIGIIEIEVERCTGKRRRAAPSQV